MAPKTRTVVIPFGPFLPDRGVAKVQAEENYLVDVRNMVPQAMGWAPMHGFRTMSALTAPAAGSTEGAGLHILGKYLYKVHGVSTSGYVWVTNPREAGLSYQWDTESVAPAVQQVVPPHVGGHFTAYGDAMILTTGEANEILYYLDDGSWPPTNVYEPLITEGTWDGTTVTSSYYYRARFCGTAGQKIVIAYLYGGVNGESGDYEVFKNRVAWSAKENPQEFHDQNYQQDATQSGWAELPDNHGPITGMCADSDYILIFKARTIYRMSPVGGLYHYEFQPIPQDVGTVWPHSIVRVGNDVFFWSGSGPAVYRGASHSVEFLGIGKVSRWVNDENLLTDDILEANFRGKFLPDSRVALLSAAADQYSGTVSWSLPISGGEVEGETTNFILVFNYIRNTFSLLDVGYKTSAGITLSVTHMLGTSDTGDYYRPLRDTLYFTGGGTSFGENLHGFKRDRDGADNYPELEKRESNDRYEEDRKVYATFPFTEYMPGNRCKINGVRFRYTRRADANDTGEHKIAYLIKVYSRDSHQADASLTVYSEGSSETDMDRRGFVRIPNCPYRVLHLISVEIYGNRPGATDPDQNNVGAISEIEGITVELEQGGEK